MLAKNILKTFAASALVASAGFTVTAKADGLYEGLGSLKDTAVYERTPMWSGLYVGVHGGWAWANWNGPYSYDDNSTAVEIAWGDFDSGNKSIKDNNWFTGASLGGDQQFGNLVAGVVVDASVSNLGQTDTFVPYPEGGDRGFNTYFWNVETEIEYFGTARGRIGYLLKDNFLVYATGGLAWAMVKSSIAPFDGATQTASASAENNHIGWAAGAGSEWRLSEHVSFTTEYLYMDLGEQDYRFAGTTNGGGTYATDNYHPDLDIHALKAGLNYRF